MDREVLRAARKQRLLKAQQVQSEEEVIETEELGEEFTEEPGEELSEEPAEEPAVLIEYDEDENPIVYLDRQDEETGEWIAPVQYDAETGEPVDVEIQFTETEEGEEPRAFISVVVFDAEGEPILPIYVEEEISEESEEIPIAPEMDMVMPLMDLEGIGESAEIDLALFGEASDNPHWVVFADGNPVAKIALQDQARPDEIKELFIKSSYKRSVKEAVAKMGIKEVLPSLKAKLYAETVRKNKMIAGLRGAERKKLAREFEARNAKMQESFLENIDLVLEAMQKNFILENPLKDALFTGMKAAGVHDPLRIIKNAFSKEGRAFFDTVIKKATEWGGMSKAARAELAQTVAGMKEFEPAGIVSTAGTKKAAAPVVRPQQVPFQSYTDGQEGSSLRDRLRKGLKGRVTAGVKF